MVKAYLRYEPASSFGVIASVESNIAYDSSGKDFLSPALEKIGVWHVRQGLCTKILLFVELVCRIGTLLLQTHYNQLLSTPAARPILTVFSDIFYERVKGWKDILGFNLAAMDHIQQMMASRSDALFRDARAKLLEIRAQQSKRLQERSDIGEVKRKKKKKT
ncbi:uncharacterized protein LOC133309912 [Gastrolobium bilobum]|uniref:uncharacterized protein LOC133309912 n=1 Tax=Gastrolobium bilobum TaxID=150636 RepID=UPI002AB2ADF0|nr:uncharacterized protein LOC133309912 [Gastrolobium bilobum]